MENGNMEVSKRKNIKNYLKKYSYYIALALLVIFLAVAIIVTSALSEPKVEKTIPTNAGVITFSSPVLNGTILKGYSDKELQYNKTLNVWEIHKGIDFAADIGTDVLAAYDGVVTSVSTNLLAGTVVEIDHGNGLKTTYGSLDSNVPVSVGQNVLRGDIIGKASNTATAETSTEGEVHFEVWKDGNLVDPSSYLDISNTK